MLLKIGMTRIQSKDNSFNSWYSLPIDVVVGIEVEDWVGLDKEEEIISPVELPIVISAWVEDDIEVTDDSGNDEGQVSVWV